MDKETAAIRKSLLTKKTDPGKPAIHRDDFLSSGSRMMNLAATGKTYGCFAKGHYYWFVGDSDSGKTWLTLTCLAEAAMNKHFKDYRFIFINSERGALMNMEHYYGKKMADRLETYELDTIEDFYYFLDDLYKDGRPFILIQDSMDVLDSKSAKDKFQKTKNAKTGQKIAGSYGDGKAKINSTQLRAQIGRLQETGSILIIISQTRDNIGFGAQFNPKTYSGGHALKFYATFQIWTSVMGMISKKVGEKNREMGTRIKINIKKNRVTGRKRSTIIPIYHSVGIDDIGGMIDYLLEEGHWKKGSKGIMADELSTEPMKYEDLVAHVQEMDLEADLAKVVSSVWHAIEAKCAVTRKKRYK